MVKTNASLVCSPPASVTVTVIVVGPTWFGTELIVIDRFVPLPPSTMFPLGITAGLDEVAVTVRSFAAVSASPTVNAIGPVELPSKTNRLPMSEIVGKSLTAATFKTNVSVAVNPPASVTVKVIVVLPN